MAKRSLLSRCPSYVRCSTVRQSKYVTHYALALSLYWCFLEVLFSVFVRCTLVYWIQQVQGYSGGGRY